MIECPVCHTRMSETARFCPSCGTPRTWVREQLERQAATSGVPYEQLLLQAREEDRRAQSMTPGAPWTASAPPPPPPAGRSRLWLVLGIIGGSLLLLCVICTVATLVVWNRYDASIGEDDAGRAARRQLEAAGRGDFEERWDLLHPDQRRDVPLEDFVDCADERDIDNVDVLFAITQHTDVALVGDRDVRWVAYSADKGGSSVTDVIPMVEEDGEWYWVMENSELDAYLFGDCP